MSASALAASTSRPPTPSLSLAPGFLVVPGVSFCLILSHLAVMTIAETANDIREEFTWLDDWEARYAHIIDLGKANPPLSPEERTEETRVRGCASQVWMVTDLADGQMTIRAESDAQKEVYRSQRCEAGT